MIRLARGVFSGEEIPRGFLVRMQVRELGAAGVSKCQLGSHSFSSPTQVPWALQAVSAARHRKGQMVVKSCAVAEAMTQLESPGSPSVSANSTGAVLCGARSAETLWTSTPARPPRRQSGWTRPEI